MSPHFANRRAALALATVGVLTLALSGCSAAVPVDAAPHATDPVCAQIVLAVPRTLGSPARTAAGPSIPTGALDKRQTTSQATAAWGESQPIILRCGVEPPAPTTDQCISIDSTGSASVDWVMRENDDSWTFVTYGRSPAVEVVVPKAAALDQPTAVLVDIASAVAIAPATRQCY